MSDPTVAESQVMLERHRVIAAACAAANTAVTAMQEASFCSQNGALNPGALRNAIESLERSRKTLEVLLIDKPAEDSA